MTYFTAKLATKLLKLFTFQDTWIPILDIDFKVIHDH